MHELLSLFGYGAVDVESELPRVKKAFGRLGIRGEDIARAKARLATFYDTGLSGVRKLLGLYLRDVVDTVLAREEGKTTILHGTMCPGFDTIGCVILSRSKKVHFRHRFEVPKSIDFGVKKGIHFGQFLSKIPMFLICVYT